MIEFFERHKKISICVTIFIAILIFYMSSLTGNQTSNLGPNFSLKPEIYHFSIFLLLNFFLTISISKGKPNYKLTIIAISICILYAVSDELHQLFVPGRFCDFNDFLIDSLGILTGSIIYLWRKN